MAGTQIRSVRSAIIIDGANQYEIIATCIVAGTLADTNIFLLSILQPDDPKTDTLLRVIDLSDIPTFKRVRAEAVTASDVQWRSPEVRLLFDNIETANAGQKELASRINKLVEDFDLNNAEFEATNEVVIYPITDPSVKTQLEADYVAARDAANALEDIRNAKAVECNLLQTDLAVTQDRLNEATIDFQDYTTIDAGLLTEYNAYTGIEVTASVATTTLANQITSSDASTAQKTDMTVSNNTVRTQLAAMVVNNDAFNATRTGVNGTLSKVSLLQTRVNTLTADLSAKNLAVSTCSTELVQVQGSLDGARTVENTALADVVAVCPDFDINSV